MLKRTLTGTVILLLTVAFVLLKQVHPLFFDAYVLILSVGSIIEVSKAYKTANKNVNMWALLVATVGICIIFNVEQNIFKSFVYEFLIVILLFALFIACDIFALAKNRKNETTNPDVEELNKSLFENTKYSMMALAYPVLLISFLYALNHLPYDIGYMGIIVVFSITMLTDTCAYFVGRLLGKKKLIPEVSPNKTVAGMIGGFVGGLLGSVICFLIFYYTKWFALSEINLANSLSAFLVAGVFGSLFTQFGDLVASAFKRKIGIKDFSNIFPGHGGFMDRVDGLMFNSAFVFITFTLLLV